MSRVVLPVDRLDELWPLAPGAKVGALLHGASTTGDLVNTLDVLERLQANGRIDLTALFGPQHGFLGHTQDNMIEWSGFRHSRLGIPVYSLYGEHREPTPEMLEGLDAIFVDLVDIGTRYYTFIWTLLLCMKACEKAGVHVIVADRPNPINGVTTEGKPQNPDYLSFVGLHPIPVRHGKTIGELAQQFQAERFPNCELTVLPMSGWERSMWLDQTGLPFVMTSPNMPTLDSATVYPGMCLLEATNLSEGRGTTRVFELFGAPWIDSEDFTRELNAQQLPGCKFRAVGFEPTFQKHARQPCQGAFLHVLDREAFQPYATGIEIIRTARRMYPDDFAWKPPPYEYEHEKLAIEILTGSRLMQNFSPDSEFS